ncbi:MAG: relaxase/mobilization nuclease domain-containing protein [Plesiomonas shigelloides]
MIVRFGGGNNGIAEYLENGRKAEREYTRDELDYRLVLDGDLAITNSVIQSIEDKGQERYLHITLSFHESEISKDTLEAITGDYKKMFMAAFDEQEYSFYAEAHLPKIKSIVNNKTGELVERKPHIHMVIPRTNLVTGKSMNPGGDLTNEKTQVLLDAIQESINNKYGLASPKDCVRVSEDNYPNVLSRAKGDLFRARQGELKRDIHSAVESKGIKTFSDFAELLKDFGEVRERNAGKDGAYLAVRFKGDEKFTNLKNPLFSREYIERRELTLKKPTETQIKNRLNTWFNQKSLEIKYIYPSAAKRRQEYKAIPDSQKREFLKRIDNEHRSKFRLSGERGRERSIERSIKHATRAFNPKREFGLPRMPECGLVYGLRGFDSTPPERILPDNAKRNMAEHGIKNENIRSSMRWHEHSAGRGVKTIDESSVAHELLFSHLSKRAQENERDVFAEIRKNIEPQRFVAALQRDFNIDPAQHRITKTKDGSMRLRAGERNYNASDFLTKYVNLPWLEAREYLLKVYSEQQSGKIYQLETRGVSSENAVTRFDSLNESKRYLSKFVTAEKKALYERVQQLKAELKNIPRDDRDIARGVIAYVKITSLERLDEKREEARNYISQYHANWSEDKDTTKVLDGIKQIIISNDSENAITSGKGCDAELAANIEQRNEPSPQEQKILKQETAPSAQRDNEFVKPKEQEVVKDTTLVPGHEHEVAVVAYVEGELRALQQEIKTIDDRCDAREVLLDEFEREHAERGLLFVRDFERGEISHLPDDAAREYLQEALQGRIERANGQERQEYEL